MAPQYTALYNKYYVYPSAACTAETFRTKDLRQPRCDISLAVCSLTSGQRGTWRSFPAQVQQEYDVIYIYRQKQPLEPNKTGTRMNTHLTTGNIAKLGPHPMRFGRELLQLCLWSELKCQVMSDCNTWCICCSDIYFHCVYMLLQVARVLGLSAVSLMLQWWWHDSCTMGPTWSLRDVLRCDKASPVKVSEGYRGTKQQPKSHSCWHHAF